MKMLLTILMLTASLVASGDSLFFDSSQVFESGNKLYAHCFATEGSFKEGICYGYIEGIADMASAIKDLHICVPDNATVQEVVDVTKKYLTDNPGERHLSAFSTVINALTNTFPCPKAVSPPAPKH